MKSNLIHSDIFKIMETLAPRHLAYDWDNVGLQIGSYNAPVNRIMVTLDVTDEVVDEAIEHNVDLIIAHHPMLFKPIKQLDMDSTRGRLIEKLIKHNITVYASHTNLDIAHGGVNDMLCDLLGIESREVLLETYSEQLFKIAVFVPNTHMAEVLEALNEKGAGHIGNYSHCTFQSEGKGTFKPLEGTNPFIGNRNELEKVPEIKIETIVQKQILNSVIDAMIKAHPYEEVAYDVFPLDNKGKSYGIGRIGTLKKAITLGTLCEEVKNVFDVPGLRVTGDLTKMVQKIAVVGGSGEKHMQIARNKGADAFITGDMTFHTAQDADGMGLSIIDPGHHVEKIMIKGIKDYMEEKLKNNDIKIIMSKINTEPFRFI